MIDLDTVARKIAEAKTRPERILAEQEALRLLAADAEKLRESVREAEDFGTLSLLRLEAEGMAVRMPIFWNADVAPLLPSGAQKIPFVENFGAEEDRIAAIYRAAAEEAASRQESLGPPAGAAVATPRTRARKATGTASKILRIVLLVGIGAAVWWILGVFGFGLLSRAIIALIATVFAAPATLEELADAVFPFAQIALFAAAAAVLAARIKKSK